jgi:hypothetical protein
MITRILLFLLSLGLVACNTGLGASCEETRDCREVPSGYCAVTGICVAACGSEGAPCGQGLCANVDGRLVCLPTCDSEGDCRESEVCSELEGGRACVLTDLLAEP